MSLDSKTPQLECVFQQIIKGLNLSPGVRVAPIRVTAQSTVVRLKDLDGLSDRDSVVVKIVHNSKLGKRIHDIQMNVVVRLPVLSPPIIATGQMDAGYWLAFTDVAQISERWSEHRFHEALRALVRVHEVGTRSAAGLGESVSHTPTAKEVFLELQGYSASDYIQLLNELSIPPKIYRKLVDLFLKSADWFTSITQLPLVLSHGDYHQRNVLFARGTSQPFVIDWEYAHLDIPYFDLFQYLDATSPTEAKSRVGSRLGGLHTYWDTMWGGVKGPGERRKWVRGYLRYAAIHLLWILIRIHSDRVNQTFPLYALQRQTVETVHGLLSMQRTLRKL